MNLREIIAVLLIVLIPVYAQAKVRKRGPEVAFPIGT